jgi:Raf-like protein
MLEIRAEAFETGAEMPMRLTQEGPNLSPALAFSGVPPQARSLVLIADDPDAPDPAAPKRVWLHWLVVNIDPAAQGFSEGLGTCPPDALAAVNDSGVRGWSGPRPPIGRHRYFFRLYALDTVLTLPENFTRAQAEAAMQGHILEEASTMGTYLLSVNR